MDRPATNVPSHEAVDLEDPDAAALHNDDTPDAVVPGTGIMGDETLVQDADPEDGKVPGIANVVNAGGSSGRG